ncbi:heparinase II/III family protein [Rhodococcus koreensis]|uniref:Heparinase II/III N-terminus n=1 Tax=Rhodococcus koreensis TaxID=99653 RepID=A0A1H4QCS6_9NOCA|nr:alginate lyase family protein [Rhodococcus koreensis]SEC17379.1 Heparinase II/III N-terminus [Rhodococcus koreensis]
MSQLLWRVRRLQTMGPREVAWRASRAGRSLLPRSGRGETTDSELLGTPEPDWDAALARFRECVGRPALLDRDRAADIARAHPAAVGQVIAAAERVACGRFSYFGHPEVTLPEPIDWHYDPLSKVGWPVVPASRINHRTADGDPKWIWELNRLQHLPWLAEAWLFTGEERFSDAAFRQLDSWIEQNPPGLGIGWRGAFEAGVRSISIAVALQGLRDSPGLTTTRFRAVVRLLAESARRCWDERSQFSSANNHLVGEMAGVATVAILLPELARAESWEKDAIRVLSAEAARQILPDGAGAEQSVGYQVFTSELLLTVAALLTLRDGRPPPELIAAVDRSADFIAALVGDRDPAPRYGDDDEGFALRLGAEPVRTVRDHLGTVAAVTRNASARRVGGTTLSGAWMNYARTEPVSGSEAVPEPGPRSFFAPDGGLVVLRAGARRLTMDVGPLGYLSLAAHGHADALAVTLSIDGEDVIGDPGTGSYYRHPDWRAAHRGTRAHATVCVDGLDQSVVGGPFLWTEHARVRVRSVDLERSVVDAEHSGYGRLSKPVVHRRWLIAPPDRGSVLVVDLIAGRGRHEVRTSWPLSPSLDVTPVGGGHLASRNGEPILQLVHAASTELIPYEVRGDARHGLGWWSYRLESREPSWLVGGCCAGEVPVAVATVLNPMDERGAWAEDLTLAVRDGSLAVRWRDGDALNRVTINCAIGTTAKNGDVVWNTLH